mgnify:FL=1
MFRKIYCITVALCFALCVRAEVRQHLIKPGETLYSLSKFYNVTVEAIQAANPSIEGTTIKTGMTIIIPIEEETKPVVVAKEEKNEEVAEDKKEKKTGILFSKKNKKEKKNKKNKKGEIATVVEQKVETKKDSIAKIAEEIVAPQKRVKQRGAPDNIVVILPFNLNSKSTAEDRQQMRSVEFYEGLLLAVDDAQKSGQKILIQTYDLGTKSMAEILATQSLKDADLIIAPMENKDVQAVAEYAKANDINVVSPFVFNQADSKDNKNLIQLNTSKSLLYDNFTKEVLKRFRYYEFVFITDSVYASKKDPYVAFLKKEMKAKSMKYHDFSYLNPEKLARVDSILNIDNNKIRYIPTVSTKDALQKMFPSLKSSVYVAGENVLSEKATNIAVLGYPEWVLYSNDFMSDYYDLNVHIFSKFYVNPFDEEVKDFYKKFHYWFDKEPMSLNPRYALLGYDVGKYFLSAIKYYGRNFNEHLDSFSESTLQSLMCYKKDGDGWINKGLYLVHFKQSTQIEKYEIK